LCQFFDFIKSVNSIYPITGTFYNPGPYGCFIAMIMPVALHKIFQKQNRINISAHVFIFIGIFLLPMLMGRTGIISALLGCGFVYKKFYNIKLSIRQLLVIISTALLLCVILFWIKPASALGRFLLWRVEIDACINNIISGCGWDYVAGAIGNAQEAYFAMNPNSMFKSVAGCPEYAFNEFLQITIAYGIFGLITFIGLIVFIIKSTYSRNQYGLTGAAISFVVVCLASYPLQFAEFIVVFTLLLISAILLTNSISQVIKFILTIAIVYCCALITIDIRHKHELSDKWQRQKFEYCYKLTDNQMLQLDSIYTDMMWSPRFVFDYAKALRNNNQYIKSNQILRQGLKISSDPMFLNLLGENYQNLHRYDIAERYYLRSINRLPERLYPHYLLALMYADSCCYDKAKFKATIDKAIKINPKIKSPAIKQMTIKLKALNDSIR
jgi:tetratricopeptide (TPR) repeat protein